MYTPNGFEPAHALPAMIPGNAHAFAFRGDRILVFAGPDESYAIPTLDQLTQACVAGVRAFPGPARSHALRRDQSRRRRAGARGHALRRPAHAVLQGARAAAGAGRTRVPGRGLGPHAPFLRPLRNAHARPGERARQGMPGVRPGRVSARFAGDDGAGDPWPRHPAGARASLCARHVQRTRGIRRAGRDDRGLRPARSARGGRRRSRRAHVFREPVVGVSAFADDRVHGRIRERRHPMRGRGNRRGALVSGGRAPLPAAFRVDRPPSDRSDRGPAPGRLSG